MNKYQQFPFDQMSRRSFVLQSALIGSGLLALPAAMGCTTQPDRIRWGKSGKLFSSVQCDGMPMVQSDRLLNATVRLTSDSSLTNVRLENSQPVWQSDQFEAGLRHKLLKSAQSGAEDVLEATLTIRNRSAFPLEFDVNFNTSVQPSSETGKQNVYIPLHAAALFNDRRFAALGVEHFLKDNRQFVGNNSFTCHYLEPMASFPDQIHTTALLLAPVVDISHTGKEWKAALFTSSDKPMAFTHGEGIWQAGRHITLPAGEEISLRCWLMMHTGSALLAWQAFHKFAHDEQYQVPDWVYDFRVHYYDFLSSANGQGGQRGNGYESDLPYFRDFHVGMGTQHGYYPAIGDYIQPDRKNWLAMRGDQAGPAEMSIGKMRARIKDTRAAGARAAVYMHAALFDDAADCFPELQDCITVDSEGRRMDFGWNGPDTAGTTWRASLAAAPWREHLLQQASWIMDILNPDAIVMDETFAGLGYDFHPERKGPISLHAIEFYKRMRSLVKSYGSDKAFFSSDCSMSPFVLWCDGECGDHTYPSLLGHPLYTQEPVRYLSALGNKPWRPCAWHFTDMWDEQYSFARQVGAGVGVSNGWIEYTGLKNLSAEVRKEILDDIEVLLRK